MSRSVRLQQTCVTMAANALATVLGFGTFAEASRYAQTCKMSDKIAYIRH
jgi:hypothetical protein